MNSKFNEDKNIPKDPEQCPHPPDFLIFDEKKKIWYCSNCGMDEDGEVRKV